MVREFDLFGYYPLRILGTSYEDLYIVNYRVHKIELSSDSGTMTYNLNLN